MNPSFLQLQSSLGGTTYTPNSTIIFNKLLSQSKNIQYNNMTGVIRFNTIGVYRIEWSLATSSSIGTNYTIVLALKSSQDESIIGNVNQREGLFSGSALISVNSPGVTLSLINVNSTITLAEVPVAANLTVYSAPDTGTGAAISPTFQADQISFSSLIARGAATPISLNVWYGPHYLRLMGKFTLSDNTSIYKGSTGLIGPHIHSDIYNTVGIGATSTYTGRWPIYPQQAAVEPINLFIYLHPTFTDGISFWCEESVTIFDENDYYFDFTIII